MTSEQAPNESPQGLVRLGDIERAIVDLLGSCEGPVLRSQIVQLLSRTASPDTRDDACGPVGQRNAGRRMLLEASVSRAIGSLVRKGRLKVVGGSANP